MASFQVDFTFKHRCLFLGYCEWRYRKNLAGWQHFFKCLVLMLFSGDMNESFEWCAFYWQELCCAFWVVLAIVELNASVCLWLCPILGDSSNCDTLCVCVCVAVYALRVVSLVSPPLPSVYKRMYCMCACVFTCRVVLLRFPDGSPLLLCVAAPIAKCVIAQKHSFAETRWLIFRAWS